MTPSIIKILSNNITDKFSEYMNKKNKMIPSILKLKLGTMHMNMYKTHCCVQIPYSHKTDTSSTIFIPK